MASGTAPEARVVAELPAARRSVRGEQRGGRVKDRRDFWEAYEEFRREFDLAELDIDPDEVFGDVGARLGRRNAAGAPA